MSLNSQPKSLAQIAAEKQAARKREEENQAATAEAKRAELEAQERRATQEAQDDFETLEQMAISQAHEQEAFRDAVEVAEGPSKKIQAELKKLANEKAKIDLVKETLLDEVEQRGELSHAERTSHGELARAAKEAGISEEELSTDPDFADAAEVQAHKAAKEHADLYSEATVDNPAFLKKLASLGIEAKDGPLSERAALRALEVRDEELDTKIWETRFGLPGEREKVINEILAKHPIKMEHLNLERFGRSNNTTYREFMAQLHPKIEGIPIVAKNPEIKKALVEEIATREILEQSPDYQKRQKEWNDNEKKVAEYEQAGEKANEAIQKINEVAIRPILGALGDLDPYVARELRITNPHVRKLYETFVIDEDKGEATGFRLDHGARPAVSFSEGIAKDERNRWEGMGSVGYTVDAIKQFEGVTRDMFRERQSDYIYRMERNSLLDGNLKDLTNRLTPRETVQQAHSYAKEPFEKDFARYEKSAREVAGRLAAYAAGTEAGSVPGLQEAEQKRARITPEIENLSSAQSALHRHWNEPVRVEQQGDILLVIDTKEEKYIANKQAEIVRLEPELARLTQQWRSIGPEPVGLFVTKNKKEEWRRSVHKAKEDMDAMQRQLDTIRHNISITRTEVARLRSRPDLAQYIGQEITGGAFVEAIDKVVQPLKQEVTAAQEILNQEARRRTDLEQKASLPLSGI